MLHDNPVALHAPETTRTSDPKLRRLVLYPTELRAHAFVLALILLRITGAGNVFEEVELVIDESFVKLPHAVGVPEEIRARVREIVTRAVRHVVRDLDLFHLIPVDGMRAEVARDC